MRYVKREIFKDRETYADRLFVSESTFAVADGMGKGIGARLSAEEAVRLLEKEAPIEDLEHMERFFKRANLRIMKEIAKLGDRHVAGTTLSVLSLKEDTYLIGHVGDSRIYLRREGDLQLLTEDQIRYKEGKKYVKALGIEWNPPIVLSEGRTESGDIFLLISDGVAGTVKDEELKTAISEDLERSADRIEKIYREKLSDEDLSFILVRVD